MSFVFVSIMLQTNVLFFGVAFKGNHVEWPLAVMETDRLFTYHNQYNVRTNSCQPHQYHIFSLSELFHVWLDQNNTEHTNETQKFRSGIIIFAAFPYRLHNF